MTLAGAVIEVRAGTSPTPIRELRPGEQLQPTSVGRAAMWQIDAPGVLDVHAYVYFDGQALFMQSADPSNPAKGNGQTIGAAWQQVEIPCTIELGRARLVYRTLEDTDDEDKTVARPLELFDPTATPAAGGPAAAPAPPAFRQGVVPPAVVRPQPEEEERTRFAPMDAPKDLRPPEATIVNPLEAGGGPPKPRPAAGNPWGDQPGQGVTAAGAPAAPQQPPYQGWGPQGGAQPGMMQPGMMQPGMMQPGMMQPGMMQPGMMQPGMMQPGMMQPGMMQPGMMQPGMMQPGMQPGMMQPGMMQPGMQPGMPGMMQPGMPPGMLPPQGPPTDVGKVVTATGPATPWDKIKKDWQETSTIKKGMLLLMPLIGFVIYLQYGQEAPPPPPPPPVAIIDAGGPPSTSSTTTGALPPPIAVPTTTGVIAMNPIPALPDASINFQTASKDGGVKSLEREAAEDVQNGQYQKAVTIYESLASQAQPGPQQDAYKAAASILRAKLDAG